MRGEPLSASEWQEIAWLLWEQDRMGAFAWGNEREYSPDHTMAEADAPGGQLQQLQQQQQQQQQEEEEPASPAAAAAEAPILGQVPGGAPHSSPTLRDRPRSRSPAS